MTRSPPRKIWLWLLSAWGVALCYPALDELQMLPNWRSVCVVEFSPDGQTLAAGLYEGRSFNENYHWCIGNLGQTVNLFDGRTGKTDGNLLQLGYRGTAWGTPSTAYGRYIAFAPNGTTLAVASRDGRIMLWDWRTRQLKQTLQSLNGHANAVAFAGGGQKLIAGGHAGMRIWDTGTFGEGTRVESYMWPQAIAVRRESCQFAVASRFDRWIELWDCDSGEMRRIDPGGLDGIRALVFSSDGGALAIGGEESIVVWDVESQTKRFEIHVPSAANLAFSPDGELLTMPGEDGLHFYSAETGKRLPGIPNARNLRSLAWSPDGSLLATGDYSGNVAVWEIGGRRLLWSANIEGPSRGPFYYTVAAGTVWLMFIAVTIWRAASIPNQTGEARDMDLPKPAPAAGSG